MSECNKNICDKCFGDHMTKDCPDLPEIETPNIQEPTIKDLIAYLNYQYPATKGNIPLALLCRSIEHLQLRAERAEKELTSIRLAVDTGVVELQSKLSEADKQLAKYFAKAELAESKLAVAEQEINKQKAVTATMDDLLQEQAKMIDTLSQQNQELREALQQSLIWYNHNLTNSTELDAKYRELRDVLIATTPSPNPQP